MKKILLISALTLLSAGCNQTKNISTQTNVSSTQPSADQQGSQNNLNQSTVEYTNKEYGFVFSLPSSWKGYSIVYSQWQSSIPNSNQKDFGPKILIRHPLWTENDPRQDIPVMVFSIQQWEKDKSHVSAAPFDPSELGRNSSFVFALPPRYNYAFGTGYEEVEKILASKPLTTISATAMPDTRMALDTVSSKDAIKCTARNYEESISESNYPYYDEQYGLTMTVPYNPDWATKKYRVAPVEFLSEYDASTKTEKGTFYFGKPYCSVPPESATTDRYWFREYSLEVLPYRSSADIRAAWNKQAAKNPDDGIVSEAESAGGVQYVETSWIGGLCGTSEVEIVGKRNNYLLDMSDCVHNSFPTEADLKKFISSLKFSDTK